MQSSVPTEWSRRAGAAWPLLAAASAIMALALLLAVIGPAIPWNTLTYEGTYQNGGSSSEGSITISVTALSVRASPGIARCH